MRSTRKLPSVVQSRYNFPDDHREPGRAARAFDAGSRDPLRSNLIGAGHRERPLVPSPQIAHRDPKPENMPPRMRDKLRAW